MGLVSPPGRHFACPPRLRSPKKEPSFTISPVQRLSQGTP
ncbi:hypothetical protein CSIRO_3321 [Bradyrhizobiaceae bacterium SG-6C]|nr:hypothetical protein CSIRO_3321 [Bradyrhizobiaceae bacterium SG-6C]